MQAFLWLCSAAATPIILGRLPRLTNMLRPGAPAKPFCRKHSTFSARGGPALRGLMQRRAVLANFDVTDDMEPVLKLLQKYADIPMSLADACLVRMTETLSDPLLITTDSDFRIYRGHSRQVIPSVIPG
jgi:hypothetical protein